MKNKSFSVCFTGHRAIENPAAIKEATECEVIRLIKKGARIFYTGMAVGFDLLASEIVISLKAKYPDIQLYSVLPCPQEYQMKPMTSNEKLKYIYVLSKADYIVTLSDVFYNGCFLVRNSFLVDSSQCCICYLTKGRSGTAYTVRKAWEKNIEIINIADKIK